jgi:sugar lactone lactonase YvrE
MTQKTTDSFELLTELTNDIGEGPIWSEADQSVYWVDAGLKPLSIFRYDTQKRLSSEIKLPHRAASLRMNRIDQLLIGYQRGFGLFHLQTQTLSTLNISGVNFDDERFNDSGADAKGRLWIGSFDKTLKEKKGQLYKFDGKLDGEIMDSGFMMSNAIRWSPDNKTMYFCDSRPGVIYAYDYNMDLGTLSNRRVFLDFKNRLGRPDGAAMDSEGHLWVAEIDAGQVLRISPNAIVVQEIKLPVSRPTSLAFGGKDLKTIYITSMTYGLKPDERESQHFAGKLFSMQTNVSGLAENYLCF